MSRASCICTCGRALLLFVVGCDADPSSATDQPVKPTIELGAGLSDWQPLADGDPVELIAGLQGGWHIDVGVRGEGIEPDGLLLHYEARDPTTEVSLSHVTTGLLDENNVLWTDEGWLRLGDRVVFTIEGPEAVVGSEVCLFVTVASIVGWEGEDSRCVTIVDEQP